MEVKKLKKLQKHLETLILFKSKKGQDYIELPKNQQDNTRFSINNWEFECGMPACVAGHARFVFNWSRDFPSWTCKFMEFFGLTLKETNWIVKDISYRSLNPRPKTASGHIQDVIDGKLQEQNT